ncbi:hypothetical protein HZS_4666 [Henneguya salminicola]|nr:hypothetical protein HZS_4666 [Henneguya salminicola]
MKQGVLIIECQTRTLISFSNILKRYMTPISIFYFTNGFESILHIHFFPPRPSNVNTKYKA